MKINVFALVIGLVLLAGAGFAKEEKAPQAKKGAEGPRPQKMDREAVSENDHKFDRTKKSDFRPQDRPEFKNRKNEKNKRFADRGPKEGQEFRGHHNFRGPEGEQGFRGPRDFRGPEKGQEFRGHVQGPMPFGMKDGKIEIKKVVKMLEKMDSDHDGFVSQEERMAFRAKMAEKFKNAHENKGEFRKPNMKDAPKAGPRGDFKRGPADMKNAPKAGPRGDFKRGPADMKNAP
ncbi:MAG: hypothetical protein Q4G69_02605, partial [Planctomycetia bacterium]|nr:hypothetical protein [Planctomycetia bacterium]